jgi:hypothetical protein
MSARAFWIGITGSAAFLAVFVFLFVDFETIGAVLRDANYLYVAPSVALYFVAVYFRTLRWTFLLRPLVGTPKRAIFPVVIVGYAANNLVPVRIGEVIRAYYLATRERTSAAGAFGTIAVERAADVMALLFFLALAWIFLPVTGAFDSLADNTPGGAPVLALAALTPFLLVAGAVVVLTAVSRQQALALLVRLLTPLPGRLRERALGLAGRLLDGLTVVRSPAGLAKLFALSVPVWAAEAAMYFTIAQGFDVLGAGQDQLDLVGLVLLFTAAANLAGIIPSSAGSWGPFDFFGAVALTGAGVASSTASAFALTVHVALWVPPTALGLVILIADGTSLRRLVRSAGRAPDVAAAPASPGTGEPAKGPQT